MRLRLTTALLGLALLASAHLAGAQPLAPRSADLNVSGPNGQYLSVTNKTGIQGHAAYTLEAWVYPIAYTGFPTIIGNDYTTSFWLGLSETGNVRFYPTGGIGNYVETGAVVPTFAWTHVAATYEQGVGWAIYLNGQIAASAAGITGAVGTSTGDLRIGADRESGAPAYFWQGSLDEVRLWSAARTGAQIRSTMFVEVGRPYIQTPAYAALQAAWDMNEPEPTGMADRCSGLGKADNFAAFVPAIEIGSPLIPPVSPNVALELNGVDDYAVIPMTDGFGEGVSIEAWVAPRSYANFPTIVGRGFEGSFWLGLNPVGRLRFYPTGTPFEFVESQAVIPLHRWTHVAATYRNGITTLYVNGRLDSQTGAITGPVGENGKVVHVGADNPVSFLWNGYLDEVRVTRGEIAPPDIRAEMFLGYSGYPNPAFTTTTTGSRQRWRADFDGSETTEVFGSSARLVKSGAALVSPGWPIANAPVDVFDYRFPGGLSLPDGDAVPAVTADIIYPQNLVIGDVEVFVFAPATDLSQCRVTLRSPASTTIDLVSLGAGKGRDLHTVFSDYYLLGIADELPPYIRGVKPSQPLLAFSGESTQGVWQLTLDGGAGAQLDLWAWGIRFTGISVGVGGNRLPQATDLRMAGAHPVRGAGSLVFDLPRAANVDLSLVDVQGRRVRTLFEGAQAAGTVSLQWRTSGIAPGVYFAVLRLDGALEKQLRVVVVE